LLQYSEIKLGIIGNVESYLLVYVIPPPFKYFVFLSIGLVNSPKCYRQVSKSNHQASTGKARWITAGGSQQVELIRRVKTARRITLTVVCNYQFQQCKTPIKLFTVLSQKIGASL